MNTNTVVVDKPISKFSISPEWQGALWKILSMSAYATATLFVKKLSLYEITLSPYEILFFQSIIGLVLLLSLDKSLTLTLPKQNLALHATRVMMAAAGVIFFYTGLERLPLAAIAALDLLSPFFATVGAFLLLNEAATPRRIIAVTLAFSGAIIIAHPWTAFQEGAVPFNWALLFPIGNAFFYACSKLATRALTLKTEHPSQLTAYLLLFLIPTMAIPMFFHWQTPSLEQIGLLSLIGIFITLGHFALAKSCQLSELTLLLPFGFLKPLMHITIGIVVFNELPEDPALWTGLGIIFVSMYLLFSKKTAPKTDKTLTPAKTNV